MVKVIYFVGKNGESPIVRFLDSLSTKQQTKILRILLYLEEYGLHSIIPHIKRLTNTPLWEIRILGRDNIRLFYVVLEQENILVLHGFIKKKQKTPQKEITLALERLKEWKNLD